MGWKVFLAAFAVFLSSFVFAVADYEHPTLARTPWTTFSYMFPASGSQIGSDAYVYWNQTDYMRWDGVPYPQGTGIKRVAWNYRVWKIPEGSSQPQWPPGPYTVIYDKFYSPPGTPNSSNVTYGEGVKSFLFAASALPDGFYDFDVWMEDFAGNGWWSGWGGDWILYSLKIPDKTAPNVSVSGAPASWSNATATVSVACNDNVSNAPSGCNSSTYKFAQFSYNPGSCPANYSSYTVSSPLNVSLHAWVCATAKDKRGNTGYSQPAKEILVDNVFPYGEATRYPSGPTAYQNVTYTAYAYDTLSGVNKIELVVDGATVKTCMYSNSCAYNASAGANGTYHSYYGSYYDNAGNWNWTGMYGYNTSV